MAALDSAKRLRAQEQLAVRYLTRSDGAETLIAAETEAMVRVHKWIFWLALAASAILFVAQFVIA